MEKRSLDLIGFSNEVLMCARELGVELAISPKTLYIHGAHGLTLDSRTELLNLLINLKQLIEEEHIKKSDKEAGLALIDSYVEFLLMNELASLNLVN